MPPKRTKPSPAAAKSASQKSSSPSTSMATALESFKKQLQRGKKSAQEINFSGDIVDLVNDILRTRRGNDTADQPRLIANIIAELGASGEIASGRLGVKAYTTLLRLFLHSVDCPQVERGLCLLAAALYEDGSFTDKERSNLAAKQISIGETCLEPLLNFFTNTSYLVPLRRWAGILLIQLLQNCDKNTDRIALGSQVSRSKLGKLILTETNEVVKIICGRIIRVLVDSGVSKDQLWPDDADGKTYEGFPDSSQPGNWNTRFQTYLDELEPMSEAEVSENGIALIYFAQDVDTVPPYGLERLGHTTYLTMTADSFSIWLPAFKTQLDQFLEIPLQRILGMAINGTAESQPDGVATFLLDIENEAGKFCSLNGVGTDLDQVLMHMNTADAANLKQDLLRYLPGIDDRSEYDILGIQSQPSIHSSTCDEPIVLQNPHELFDANEPAKGGDISKSRESLIRGDKAKSHLKATDKNDAAVSKSKGKQNTLVSQIPRSEREAPSYSLERCNGADIEEEEPQRNLTKKAPSGSKPASQQIEQKVVKLAHSFPATKSPTVRGALVVSNGDLDAAFEVLRREHHSEVSSDKERPSRAKEDSSTRLDKTKAEFDSGSFTSLSEIDASTPFITRAAASRKNAKSTGSAATAMVEQNKKSQTSQNPQTMRQSADGKHPKYSLKAKPPLGVKPTATRAETERKTKGSTTTRSQEKPNQTTAASSFTRAKPRAPGKLSTNSQAEAAAASSDPYEIPADRDDGKSAATSKKTRGSAKVRPKKAPQKTKDIKKQQSASAALETTAAATRSRRHAAPPSQNLRNSNPREDGCGVNEKSVPLDKSQSSRPEKVIVKPLEEIPIPENSPQGQEEVSDAGEDSQPVHDEEHEADLYDASPKEETKKPTKEVCKISSQAATQNFSSKLEEILHGIDAEPNPDLDRGNRLQNHKAGGPNVLSGKPTPDIKATKDIGESAQADLEVPRVSEIKIGAQKLHSANVVKRKASVDAETPPKRRRSRDDAFEANQEQPLRRSPRLKARDEETLKNTKQKPHESQQNASSSPSRSSPRLEDRAKAAKEAMAAVLSDKPLIDDQLTRKVHIVNFGKQGAMNQGPSSVLRNSAQKSPSRPSKRTREYDPNALPAAQSNKRRIISPCENYEAATMVDEGIQQISSSPPVSVQQKARFSKSSSQPSRVDFNGSPKPMASAERIDHISKVTQSLMAPHEGEKAQAPESVAIFGPRIKLASIPKTGPSSPNGIEVRYVKHHKVGNGVYKGVESKKFVAAEHSLADPFIGCPARRSSGFDEKLQAGASKETKMVKVVQLPQETSQASRKNNQLGMFDETTLVNAELELTSRSSEDDTRSPFSEKAINGAWIIPLRPHYENISDIVHRVAEEVIIRLTNEEEVMGLLLKQYKSNGDKHLGTMISKRDQEKENIDQNLNGQMDEMVGVYGEAKVFVNKSEKLLKTSTLAKFEKQWRSEQDRIQHKITKGRKMME